VGPSGFNPIFCYGVIQGIHNFSSVLRFDSDYRSLPSSPIYKKSYEQTNSSFLRSTKRALWDFLWASYSLSFERGKTKRRSRNPNGDLRDQSCRGYPIYFPKFGALFETSLRVISSSINTPNTWTLCGNKQEHKTVQHR